MHKVLLFFFTLLTVNSITAQKDIVEKETQVGLSEVEFQKAKDDYLKMTRTETYKANNIAMMKLNEKIKALPIPKELMDEGEWSNWVTENLSKTKFKNVDEAIKMRKIYLESYQKQMSENADLYRMIKKASMEQLHEILKPERAGRPF